MPRIALLLLALFVIPSIAGSAPVSGVEPIAAPTFADDFERTTLGSDYAQTDAFPAYVSNGALQLQAWASFSGVKLLRPITDGTVAFTWDPHAISASGWKQLYVTFRDPSGPAAHRVIFSLDDGTTLPINHLPTVRFDSGLTNIGEATAGHTINAPLVVVTPARVVVTHADGLVSVTVNSVPLGAATYPALETADTLAIRAADNYDGHSIDGLRYWNE